METCGMSCIKWLLIFFNFIFAISGIGIIVAGAYVLKDVDDYSAFVKGGVLAPPIILIVAGIIVFLVSFLGFCGAMKENYNMLIAYAVFLLLIFIVEIAVGIAAAVNKESLTEFLKKDMKDRLKNNNYGTDSEDRQLWGKLQSRLQCCGVDGPGDWVMGGLYPESCCKNSEPSSPDRLCGPSREFVYQEGCYNKLSERLREGSNIVMGVGIGIALVELAGVVLSCLLASAIKKEKDEDAEEKE